MNQVQRMVSETQKFVTESYQKVVHNAMQVEGTSKPGKELFAAFIACLHNCIDRTYIMAVHSCLLPRPTAQTAASRRE